MASKESKCIHLTKLTDLNASQIHYILDMAADIKASPEKYEDALHKRSLLMFFEKPSLRTRVSFEAGMSEMGGHAIFYPAATELQGKKESLGDTAKVLSRYVDAIMARVKSREEIRVLAEYSSVPVINGLDDYAHPCQVLADMFTIREKKGLLPLDWKELQMAYVGDCRNNVTYDLMRAAALLGFRIRVAGPKGPHYEMEQEVLDECKLLCHASGGRIEVLHDATEAVKDADVVYTDSWMSYGIPEITERERIEQFKPFQVTEELLANAKQDVIFMNCLPAMRGMEQTAGVIDGSHSVVLDEAENRNHVQKAILSFLISKNPRLSKAKQRIVVALGGNALIKPDEKGTLEEQSAALDLTCSQILLLLLQGYEVVITHGNGPQVGAIVLQNEKARDDVPSMPLPVCGAESQGSIGYMIQNKLHNELVRCGINREVVTIVTEMEVSASDPALLKPSKPIGPFYTEDEAKKLAETGKVVIDDAGRGWRVVVPSPRPIAPLQMKAIRLLVNGDCIVIAAGGGGIPVIRQNDGSLVGIDAVIDKDFGAKCLAVSLHAEIFLILTDVECAYKNYKDKKKRIPLHRLKVAEAKKLIQDGEFSSGSMLPKIEACIEFVEKTGKPAVITSLERAAYALSSNHEAGTHIVP